MLLGIHATSLKIYDTHVVRHNNRVHLSSAPRIRRKPIYHAPEIFTQRQWLFTFWFMALEFCKFRCIFSQRIRQFCTDTRDEIFLGSFVYCLSTLYSRPTLFW